MSAVIVSDLSPTFDEWAVVETASPASFALTAEWARHRATGLPFLYEVVLRQQDRTPVVVRIAADEAGAASLARAAQLHISGPQVLNLDQLDVHLDIEVFDRIRYNREDS